MLYWWHCRFPCFCVFRVNDEIFVGGSLRPLKLVGNCCVGSDIVLSAKNNTLLTLLAHLCDIMFKMIMIFFSLMTGWRVWFPSLWNGPAPWWLQTWTSLPSLSSGINLYVPESYVMYLSDRCWFLLLTCGRERGGWRGVGNLYCTYTVGISTVLFPPPSRVQMKFQLYPYSPPPLPPPSPMPMSGT